MTGTVPSPTCPTCGAEPAADARFCPQCGGQLAPVESGGSTSAATRSDAEPSAAAAQERHVFGLAPPGVVLVLGVAGLFLAVVMFAFGHNVAGFVLLAVALGLGALLVSTARQVPDGRLARTVVRAHDGARGRAGFVWVSAVSWLGAGRKVVELRRRRLEVRREQKALIDALGDAVYRGDLAQAASLKADARERADRIEDCERELAAALAAARERVGRERLTIQSTKVFTGTGRDNSTG